MSLVYSIFVPHPPLFVPEIGRGEEQKCRKSLDAYREIAGRVVNAGVETVILVSPHAPLFNKGMTLPEGTVLEGDFAQFGAPRVSLSFTADSVAYERIREELPGVFPVKAALDHGSLIPLYFLREAGWKGQAVVLGMPLEYPEPCGVRLGEILEQLPGRYGLVASGDMSHCLKKDGPYGFDPAGPECDRAVIDALRGDARKIAALPAEQVEKAAECGYRSLRLALAAKEGAPEVLSYEDTFGVGYMVADLYHSSPLPGWARQCLEAHLRGEQGKPAPPAVFSESFSVRRGCFVTLKQKGELRGCIGTTEPWQENLALEIRHNAVAAGTEDPRFWPVSLAELDDLSISVDVLGELEKITGPEDLDPWRYGVVVQRRGRRGLLLPHLEGVDTVEQQISISRQKAGIGPDEPVELWRFEVRRHYE